MDGQRAYALGQWYDIVGQAHGGGRGGGGGGRGMGMRGGPGPGMMMRDRGDRHDRRDYWRRRQRRDFYPYGMYGYGYDPYAYLYGYDGYGYDGGYDDQAAIWAAYFAGQQAAQQQVVPVPVPVPGAGPAPAPAPGPGGPPAPAGPPPAGAPGAPPVASGWYNLEGPAVGQWYDLQGPMVGQDVPAGAPFPPRAALVEAPAPTQANRDILPMSTGVPILPTQSAQITGRPQTIAYKIGCYKISNAGTAGGAADWIVNDIKIGNRSQFVQSGDVPGDVFATNAIDTFVRFETAQTAMDVVVVVTYIGLNESGCPFFSAMIGTAAV